VAFGVSGGPTRIYLNSASGLTQVYDAVGAANPATQVLVVNLDGVGGTELLTVGADQRRRRFSAGDPLVGSWSGAANGDYFGYSIAIRGGSALIGASGAQSNTGAAYLYSFGDPAKPSIALQRSDASAGDAFGAAVAFGPLGPLVGAPGVTSDQGEVYAYQPCVARDTDVAGVTRTQVECAVGTVPGGG
jgi:hypothetical protein